MRTVGRWLYFIFAIIFLLCSLGQFFLAGMAIFGEGQFWSDHKMLAHLFGLNIPIIMMISAFMGNAKREDYFSILGLLILIITMYATANLGFRHPFLGALHPILGVLIIMLSILNVFRSKVLLGNKK
ncbi:DUF6220 domain-containing protein [Lentibacillus amyloliquefaciens]|uniref:Uncharacterized protein n=1 Tax=Lentibacillus amyloliquefaciens TaxID=1472767 RepID=A0A0U4E783_9BACI|nr:DUF6220 domain-containing protein [Lentibacillus amyloliquefaciens]ALX49180.1 hypothetical protein AOX59_11630 [Lentibacillus amyloliquefaciens]